MRTKAAKAIKKTRPKSRRRLAREATAIIPFKVEVPPMACMRDTLTTLARVLTEDDRFIAPVGELLHNIYVIACAAGNMRYMMPTRGEWIQHAKDDLNIVAADFASLIRAMRVEHNQEALMIRHHMKQTAAGGKN